MTCGAGTEFNPAIMTCDYPLRDRTGCSNRGWKLSSITPPEVIIRHGIILQYFNPIWMYKHLLLHCVNKVIILV